MRTEGPRVGDVVDVEVPADSAYVGVVRSLVQSTQTTSSKPSAKGKGKRSGGKKDEPEKDTGQKTLFR